MLHLLIWLLFEASNTQLCFWDGSSLRFTTGSESELQHKKRLMTLLRGSPLNFGNTTQCNFEHQIIESTSLIIRRNSQILLKISGEPHEFEVVDKGIKYGLGQRNRVSHHLQDGTYTIWNRDRPFQIDYGSSYKSGQTHGHYPAYFSRYHGKYHFVYFYTTHPIKYEIAGQIMKISTTDPIIDVIVIVGDTSYSDLWQIFEEKVLGVSSIPPLWSMGWHHSRWGIRNPQQWAQILDEFNQNGVPIDVIWLDLDYMKNKMPFVVDQQVWSRLGYLINDAEVQLVPLIDAGISLDDAEGCLKGYELAIFLRNSDNKYFYGKVWPGDCHFVDVLNDKAQKYWWDQLDRVWKSLSPINGFWVDMNEPAVFDGNSEYQSDRQIQTSQPLGKLTVPPNLVHQGDFEHIEVHAYYGQMLANFTRTYLLDRGHSRPFVLSRSGSVGLGSIAAHWSGDNRAYWQFLKASIWSIFECSMFGIKMCGADICGFSGFTNAQLCGRWIQLGALYPFSRNHKQINNSPEEPTSLGDQVLKTHQIAIKVRYCLIHQIYTWMQILKQSYYQPLWSQFSINDHILTSNEIQTQIIIGKGLMQVPIVESNHKQRLAYFPGQNLWWHQLIFNQETGLLLQGQGRNIIFEITDQLPLQYYPLQVSRLMDIHYNQNKTTSDQNDGNNIDDDQKLQLETQDKQPEYDGVTYHKGDSFSLIKNRLPSHSPLFISSGTLIFTTASALRINKIKRDYNLICFPNVFTGHCSGVISANFEHSQDKIQITLFPRVQQSSMFITYQSAHAPQFIKLVSLSYWLQDQSLSFIYYQKQIKYDLSIYNYQSNTCIYYNKFVIF